MIEVLDRQTVPKVADKKQIISQHEDELIRVEDVFGDNLTPEDYIESFERYIRENMNQLPGLIAATQRPRELTRKALKDIAGILDDNGFSETALRLPMAAHGMRTLPPISSASYKRPLAIPRALYQPCG